VRAAHATNYLVISRPDVKWEGGRHIERGRRLPSRDSATPAQPALPRPTSPTSPTSPVLKVPHVGWNSLEIPRATGLLHQVAAGAQVYFTHSFAAPVVSEAAATTTYGSTFTSAVQRGRVAGVQFHPEKSGDVGLHILRNWLVMHSRAS
jgi:hypothetical protein